VTCTTNPTARKSGASPEKHPSWTSSTGAANDWTPTASPSTDTLPTASGTNHDAKDYRPDESLPQLPGQPAHGPAPTSQRRPVLRMRRNRQTEATTCRRNHGAGVRTARRSTTAPGSALVAGSKHEPNPTTAEGRHTNVDTAPGTANDSGPAYSPQTPGAPVLNRPAHTTNSNAARPAPSLTITRYRGASWWRAAWIPTIRYTVADCASHATTATPHTPSPEAGTPDRKMP
jgi:hypothetical protein